jgi:hypothetical protein
LAADQCCKAQQAQSQTNLNFIPLCGQIKYMRRPLGFALIAAVAIQVALSFPPAVKPSRPALFRPPLIAFPLDPYYFQPIEAGSDALYHDRAINMPNNMAIRLKLPYPALMNHENEPTRFLAHDTPHSVKRA